MTNIITQNKRKCDVELHHPQKARKRYSVSSNLSSSIERADSPSKLQDRIELHGGERIQSLGTLFYAYGGKGVRSDGSCRDIKVNIGHSKLQVGKGTRNEHAAHSNPCSGVQDNYFKLVANDIKKEKKITPLTEKVLSRALNPKVWKVVKNLDFADDNCNIDEYLPTSSSLIEHSIIAPLLNGTHVLPRAVNLKVDCPLEGEIRSIEAELIQKVCVNRLTPTSALIHSKERIERHFQSQTKKYQESGANEILEYTNRELEGTQNQDPELLNQYLFNEFLDENGNMDVEKTLRLLEYR